MSEPQRKLALQLQQWLIDAVWDPKDEVTTTAVKQPLFAAWFVTLKHHGEPVLKVEIRDSVYAVFGFTRMYTEIAREPHEYEHIIKHHGRFAGWHMNSAESVVRTILLLHGFKLDL